MAIKPWVEAMRLRTLPVSIAGVVGAVGIAVETGSALAPVPAVLCLVFAVLAQIASNFANEYYDFRAGLDRAGRDGPRRGVTEGDITPRAMLYATFITLGLACAVGCSLIVWGGWWLVPVGLLIAVGVIAYSTGPYPLSHHGLGEVAVMLFFGVIPVNFTYYLCTGAWTWQVLLASVSYGLMGANVLLVNNYRDYYDDLAVGKRTLAVICGRRTASTLYLFNGFMAMALMLPWMRWPGYILAGVYLCCHVTLWEMLLHRTGRALNPLLGLTSLLMLAFAVLTLLL